MLLSCNKKFCLNFSLKYLKQVIINFFQFALEICFFLYIWLQYRCLIQAFLLLSVLYLRQFSNFSHYSCYFHTRIISKCLMLPLVLYQISSYLLTGNLFSLSCVLFPSGIIFCRAWDFRIIRSYKTSAILSPTKTRGPEGLNYFHTFSL